MVNGWYQQASNTFVLKKFIILFGIILVVLVLGIVLFTVDLHQRDNADFISKEDVSPFLQDGDVICRLGDRIWSLVFKEFSPVDKRYSHLGIVSIDKGQIFVINAQGSQAKDKNKVALEPLEDFLENAQQVGIYRMNGNDASRLSQNALTYVGYPFDWDFDMDDDSALYCSELLFVTLKNISAEIPIPTIWIEKLSKNIVPVDICSQSEYFTEIHFFGEVIE
jgi:uncharacterized protein YycO